MPDDLLSTAAQRCPVLLPADWRRDSIQATTRATSGTSQSHGSWSFGRILPDARVLICTVPGAVSTWARQFVNELLHSGDKPAHAEMANASCAPLACAADDGLEPPTRTARYT